MILQECSLPCCKLVFSKNRGISLHRTPSDTVRRQRWSKATGTDLHIADFVCSRHFRPKDYKEREGKKILGRNAVPSRCFGFVNKYGTSQVLLTKIRRKSVPINNHCDRLVCKECVPDKFEEYKDDNIYLAARKELLDLWNILRAQILKNSRCIATLEEMSRQQDIQLNTIQNELRILKTGVL